MGYFCSKLAKEAGRLNGWTQKIFGRRYQAIVVSDEEPVQLERLRYGLAHAGSTSQKTRGESGPRPWWRTSRPRPPSEERTQAFVHADRPPFWPRISSPASQDQEVSRASLPCRQPSRAPRAGEADAPPRQLSRPPRRTDAYSKELMRLNGVCVRLTRHYFGLKSGSVRLTRRETQCTARKGCFVIVPS
jgi:hypothetical protein